MPGTAGLDQTIWNSLTATSIRRNDMTTITSLPMRGALRTLASVVTAFIMTAAVLTGSAYVVQMWA